MLFLIVVANNEGGKKKIVDFDAKSRILPWEFKDIIEFVVKEQPYLLK